MYLGIGNPIENRNLCDDINLGLDSNARLHASELRPSEYGYLLLF